jgi:hypothetical protein
MENASVGQLVRIGAYTTIGGILAYGVLALALGLLIGFPNPTKPAKTSSPSAGCGCGGHA